MFHIDQQTNNIYFCLRDIDSLTSQEKIDITKSYPQDDVKEAIDFSKSILDKSVFEQITIYCKSKVNSTPSFWQKNKKILIGTAIVASALAIGLFYKYSIPKFPFQCTEGHYDDLTTLECKNGKYVEGENLCTPECSYEKYFNLIKSCKLGEKISGCFHGKYYRELTQECIDNPGASLCDGNYDHDKWVNRIYNWMIPKFQ